MKRPVLIKQCQALLSAYRAGKLGQTKMPEDANPGFTDSENKWRLAYFTLPMALNYQRDSYKLWEAALQTYRDPQTRFVFSLKALAKRTESEIRNALLQYRLALQPNKHIQTWRTVASTVLKQWDSFEQLFVASGDDFLKLRKIVQQDYKKGFPYLSGPKIFNYWAFVISTYGQVKLKNRNYIEIAPDTHITQCSVKLGVISANEALKMSKEAVSARWREALKGSKINPIDLHPPLWFWSRNGFVYKLPGSGE